MDAREAREWLSLQTIHAEDCDFRPMPNSHEELTPMTDEQWQKAKRLAAVLPARFQYSLSGERGREIRREVEFVKNFIQLPYDAPLDRRQSQLLERIWVKYRRFHEDILAQPRWIEDYTQERWKVTGSDSDYVSSEIGRFNDAWYRLIDHPYACDPANDKFTIMFQDGDLW